MHLVSICFCSFCVLKSVFSSFISVLHYCLAINIHLLHSSPLAPAGTNWEPEATLALHGDLSCPLHSVMWLWLDSGFLQILLPGHFKQDFKMFYVWKTTEVLIKGSSSRSLFLDKVLEESRVEVLGPSACYLLSLLLTLVASFILFRLPLRHFHFPLINICEILSFSFWVS